MHLKKRMCQLYFGFDAKEDELINEKRLKSEDLEKINNIIKIMDASKAINIDNIITEINVENKENYVIYLESKNKKINLGTTEDLQKKMLYIQRILENEEGKNGTIFVNGNLSSGFKPYFREE